MDMKKRFIATVAFATRTVREVVEIAFNTESDFHMQVKSRCRQLFAKNGVKEAGLIVRDAVERATDAPVWAVTNWPKVNGRYSAVDDRGLVKLKHKHTGR